MIAETTAPAEVVTLNVHDTHIGVWFESAADDNLPSFLAILRFIERSGFAVYPCEETRKRYRTLTRLYRRGHHGRLKLKASASGRHLAFLFYQTEVFENRNGGEYDFDKIEKMPYLVRLRFQWVQARLLEFLAGHLGARREPRACYATSTPLEVFNNWDFPSDRVNGGHRFDRGPDGWPTEKELRSWRQTDGDHQVIRQGSVRYVQIGGRWLRCRVYGGINGMWHCVDGRRLIYQASSGSLRSTYPGRGRSYRESDVKSRLERALAEAVKDKAFLRAHAIQRVIERGEATHAKDERASGPPS